MVQNLPLYALLVHDTTFIINNCNNGYSIYSSYKID